MILDFNDPITIDCFNSYVKEKQLSVGITSGCWDLTHYYHIRYWERCKRFCDLLVVGVDDDFLVKSFKGSGRPIFNEGHRLILVSQSQYVSAAFLMHEVIDLEKMIKLIKPVFMFKNQVFNNPEELEGGKVIGAEHTKLIIIDDVEEKTSTTEFINSISGQK